MLNKFIASLLVLLFLFPMLSHALTPTLRSGFTFDNCKTSEDCHPPRDCIITKSGFSSLCTITYEATGCYCRNYNGSLPCDGLPPRNDTSCPRGEICVKDNREGEPSSRPYCLSCSEVVNNPSSYTPTTDRLYSTCPVRSHRGLSLDPCNDDVDCTPPRRCVDRLQTTTLNQVLCTSNSTSCACFSNAFIPLCDACTPCQPGERCFMFRPDKSQRCVSELAGIQDPKYLKLNSTCAPSTNTSSKPPNISTSPMPSPSPSSSLPPSLPPSPTPLSSETPRCIDVRHLDSLSHTDRVFANDILTEVLCDDHDSCATSGHMVVFRRRAMSMRRYCMVLQRQGDGDGCVTKMRWVNSPRMRRGRRVGSRTDGLEFTALAARYGSRAEEILLGMLVRSGL